ncbi:putative D-xylulose reductase A [Vanrija pseudolonga]|uniref:D-xylulose reductase A n=1 Tax=Vanrija pseudolonga TaxID=143232 RepID=A0AAF0YJE1_9TREE|nr:putative D-xylulose reductase A [Vanrija pseudolonga]
MTLKNDNPSFVLHGVYNTQFDERPIPELEGDEVLVAIAKTGICGSDVHYLQHGKIGHFVVEEPMCLGHESAGTIVKLGPKVPADAGVAVGDRVALEPGHGCRTCVQCKGGHYELCPKMTFAATPPFIYGTLCRYFKIPFDYVYKLPENVTFEDGALLEPLTVSVHALYNLGGIRGNDTVLIFGAGPVGLLCMATAKALGARRVIAVDIQKDRLDFAKEYAASDVFLPPSKNEGEDNEAYSERFASALRAELKVPASGPGSIDLVVDATGAPVCIGAGLHALRPSGTFVQVGMGPSTVPIPMFIVVAKQLKIIGSFRYGEGDYQTALSLVERGLVDLKPLVTHRYKFEDALDAFKLTQAGKDANGKAVIKVIIDGPQ